MHKHIHEDAARSAISNLNSAEPLSMGIVPRTVNSKDMVAQYIFASSDCDSSSVWYAVSADINECHKADCGGCGQSYSYQLACSGDDFSVYVFAGKECHGNPVYSEPIVNATDMNTCFVNDDGNYAMWQCENSMDYGLNTAPAVGFYTGDDCDGRRIGAEYLKEADCAPGPDAAYYAGACDEYLEFFLYGSSDCSTVPAQTFSMKADKCSDDSDFPNPFDDDDMQDDDGDDDFFRTNSYYTVCNAKDLPSSGFHAVASVGGAIFAFILAIVQLVRA
jgi:hypothetical protein